MIGRILLATGLVVVLVGRKVVPVLASEIQFHTRMIGPEAVEDVAAVVAVEISSVLVEVEVANRGGDLGFTGLTLRI